MSDDQGVVAVDDGADENIWAVVACSVAVLAAVSLSYSCITPNRGTDLRIHAAYLVVAACSVVFVPESIAGYVFTELTATLVG